MSLGQEIIEQLLPLWDFIPNTDFVSLGAYSGG
jgi:hypothetical protein